MGGFLSYLSSYLPDEEVDSYLPGLGYWPSALKRGVGEIFGAGKRGVDYLASEAYKSEPVWDEENQRMKMGVRPGMENFPTTPVEELLTSAIAPKILPGDEQLPVPYQNLYNAGRGVTKLAGQFGLDPLSYGMNISGKAGSLIGGYFGAEGARHAIDAGQRAYDAPNFTEAIEPAIEAAGSGLMSGLGLHSLRKGIKGTSSEITPKTEDIFSIDEIRDKIQRMSPGVETDRLQKLVDESDARKLDEQFDPNDFIEHPGSDERMTPGEWSKQQKIDDIEFDRQREIEDRFREDVPDIDESMAAPKPGEHVLEDLVIGPDEVYNRRYQNITQEYVDRIKPFVAEVLQNPEIMNVKVELIPDGDTTPASYNAETKTMYINPKELARGGPEYMMNTISHELGHDISLHSFENIGVTPAEILTPFQERIMDKLRQQGESPEEIAKVIPSRAYTPMGEGKFAEIPPEHISHTEENITERAKYSPEEHLFQTARDSIANDPRVRELGEKYKTNISKLTADEFARARELESSEIVEGPVSAYDAPKPEGLSEPANIFKKILEEAKLTKFNRATVVDALNKQGIPVPDEMIKELPGLLQELKERGHINEKIAGTFTLQLEAPRTGSKIFEKKPSEPVMSLEDQLKSSMENIPRDKPPAKPVPKQVIPTKPIGQKLTEDELVELGKIFATKVEGKKEVSPEIKKAQEAAMKGNKGSGNKPPQKPPKPPSEFEEVPDSSESQGEDPAFIESVKLIDKIDKAQNQEILAKDTKGTGSLKETVQLADKLEKEQFKEDVSNQKQVEKEDKSLLGQQQQLEKAVTKEKLAKKSFSVTLSDGKTYTVRARNAERAKQYAEDKIRNSKSKLTIKGISEKLSPMDQALTSQQGSDPTDRLKKGFIDDITDIPKTLKASFDISWPGRQGLFLLNRKVAREGMAEGLKSGLPFKGDEFHKKTQESLANRPNAELYVNSGLNQFKYDPTEITKISERSEEFASERASRLPGVRESERMFLDMGNLARANMFDHFAEKFTKEGKTFESHPDLYKGMAEYLNTITLRKPLPEKLQKAGWILNKMFFSPMAVYSRFEQANPMWYAKLPKEMRKEALRDVGGTLGTIAGLLGGISYAANQAGIDDVEFFTDPANTHFGRLKVGKSYYDLHGLTPLLRTYYRLASGRIATNKGEYALPGGIGYSYQQEQGLEDAPFGKSAFSEATRFVENKTSPLYQTGKGLATGKDWYGNEYGFGKMLTDLVMPMSIESIVEAGSEYGGKEALKQTPELLGFSVYTEFPEGKSKGKSKGKKRSNSSQTTYPF